MYRRIYGRKFSFTAMHDHISDDIHVPPQMKFLNNGYSHSNAHMQFCLNLERLKPQKRTPSNEMRRS